MAKRNTISLTSNINRTVFSTSKNRGGRKGMTIKETGKLSQNGQYITRRQQYYNVRVGFGLSGG